MKYIVERKIIEQKILHRGIFKNYIRTKLQFKQQLIFGKTIQMNQRKKKPSKS